MRSAQAIELTAGLGSRTNKLHALLAQANRLALAPAERAAAALREQAENAHFAMSIINLEAPESTALIAARENKVVADLAVTKAEDVLDAASLAFTDCYIRRDPPWWRHVIDRLSGSAQARAAELAKSKQAKIAAQARLDTVSSTRNTAEQALRRELKAHQRARALDLATRQANATAAEAALACIDMAFRLMSRLPGLAHAGASGLLAVASTVVDARQVSVEDIDPKAPSGVARVSK